MFIDKKVFSLVELIVIVAILSILLSLIMPSLNHIVSESSFIKCANNLNRLGTSLNLMAEDNDEKYHSDELYNINVYYKKKKTGKLNPAKEANLSYDDSNKGITYDLYQNLGKDQSILESRQCPADERTERVKIKHGPEAAQLSYLFKQSLVRKADEDFGGPVRRSYLLSPSRQSLLVDKKTYHNKEAVNPGRLPTGYWYDHNLYFADGHVAMKYDGFNNPINYRRNKVDWRWYNIDIRTNESPKNDVLDWWAVMGELAE